MVDKEACIDSLLERLDSLIVDLEEWSLQDSDFNLVHEYLVSAQEEAESLRDE